MTMATSRSEICARLRTSEIRDRRLLAMIAARDRAALQELYLSYRPRLRRFLSYLTLRDDLLEDMIVDIWFAIWQAAREYRSEPRVCAWIARVALRRGLLTQLDQPRGTPPSQEPADGLLQALDALAIEQRALFALTYCFDCSCDEVAAAMHCSVGTVKSRMQHLRQQLQSALIARMPPAS